MEMKFMKSQFEEYGENLYIRLSNEMSDRISSETRRFETDLQAHIRKDTHSVLMEGLRH